MTFFEVTTLILSLLPFYFLGAFPTGRILASLKGIDLEKSGSGNTGATNVARTVGRKAGVITLCIDAIKGALAVYFATLAVQAAWYPALVSFTVVLGHCVSIPKILKGGKGVATTLGASLVLTPICTGIALLTFLIILWWRKIVSLASVVAISLAPVISLTLGRRLEEQLALMAIALVVLVRHRSNLIRISEGREPKFKIAN